MLTQKSLFTLVSAGVSRLWPKLSNAGRNSTQPPDLRISRRFIKLDLSIMLTKHYWTAVFEQISGTLVDTDYLSASKTNLKLWTEPKTGVCIFSPETNIHNWISPSQILWKYQIDIALFTSYHTCTLFVAQRSPLRLNDENIRASWAPSTPVITSGDCLF